MSPADPSAGDTADASTTRARLCLVSCPSPEAALELARAAVEARLAASANVLPAMRSVYRWQGAPRERNEHALLLRTVSDRLDALRAAILARHPDQCP